MADDKRSLVDTNVWLYAFVAGDPVKSATAASLIQKPSIAVSVQIINEVCVNLIRKARFTETQVRPLIESFYAKCLVVPIDKHVLLKASDLRQQFSLSFWDSTVVASALHCGASTLYSEDLQNGLRIENCLTVINPFSTR